MPPLDAFLQPAGGGRGGHRLYLHHRPNGGVARGAVLYVHPFGEEMNKSRRMAALQSRALAGAGYAVLQVDLFGCGDSSGEFGDATWEDWIEDVVDAARWLQACHDAPVWFWGLRAGALLATAAAARLDDGPWHFLFWQPAGSGKTQLQQFLRLAAAGAMLDGGAKGMTEALRKQLREGRPAEVAGYALHPELARGLEEARLVPPRVPGRLEWLEVQQQNGGTLAPAALAAIAPWTAAGWEVRPRIAVGPAFWQTLDIEDAPALLEASVHALAGPRTGGAGATVADGMSAMPAVSSA